MHRKIHIVIALVLLVAIAIVVFAPSVDLEPTAMRAVKAASIIFLAMAAVGQVVISFILSAPGPAWTPVHVYELLDTVSEISLVDLNCTRLC